MTKGKRTISYTRVSADIFHFGHLQLLERAKKVADYHICGLYNDEICRRWNGSLIMEYKERAAILEALYCVDEILVQKELDPTNNLKYIHNRFPDTKIFFFQGHQEWKGLPGTNYIKSIGGEIIKPDYFSKITRSFIREELNNSKVIKPYDIESYILGDISYFTLDNSSKGETLAKLKPNLNKSIIEKLFIFTTSQWKVSPERILSEIEQRFAGAIVVRSSSLVEDSFFSSYAGFFHSELNINPKDSSQVKNSISNVISSYSKHKNRSLEDQILIQLQTKNVLLSGVVFTRDMQNNAPYYLINFDHSPLTDSVTSGQVGNKLEIIKNYDLGLLLPKWKSLIESVQEIEKLLDNLALDIEFAIKNSGEVVIFQVRPITANQNNNIADQKIFNAVQCLKNQYQNYSQYSILDSHYTLSDMSFWNPAEIIGDRAGNLSYSIYRYLILNRAWNIGLVPLGYKKINRDLVVRFGNKAYIEVETAFATLLPHNLDEEITDKLITFYQRKLESNPELHDKIEFEIVHNCFSPATDDQLEEVKSILNVREYKAFRKSLIDLTQRIFDDYQLIKVNDLQSLDKLAKKRKEKIINYENASVNEKINIAVSLLDDSRELGTPQFSRMARLAFIGNQYLKGLESNGIITSHEYDYFLSNIQTVASEMKNDFDRVVSKKLSKVQFNKLYGHLRPGTYDINKLPYRKNPAHFSINEPLKIHYSSFTKKQKDFLNIEKKISEYLDDFEISVSASQLLRFIKETTQFREKFKFEFTKNLSLSLELLASAGDNLGFNREMLSHLSIENLKGLSESSSIAEIQDMWHSQIEGKKISDELSNYISLPPIIFGEEDFEVIQSYSVRPNYITNIIISGELINLDSLIIDNFDDVTGKIVLLEKADPGYDWIFSKGIKALITKFGGVASHMAIRCNEFGIPAAIGCGEIIFKDIKDRKIIELDCKNKLITVVR